MNSPYCMWWFTHSSFLWIHTWPQDAAGTLNLIVLQLGRGTGAQLGAVMNTTFFAASQVWGLEDPNPGHSVPDSCVILGGSGWLPHLPSRYGLVGWSSKWDGAGASMPCGFDPRSKIYNDVHSEWWMFCAHQVGSYMLLAILVSIFSNQLKTHAQALWGRRIRLRSV